MCCTVRRKCIPAWFDRNATPQQLKNHHFFDTVYTGIYHACLVYVGIYQYKSVYKSHTGIYLYIPRCTKSSSLVQVVEIPDGADGSICRCVVFTWILSPSSFERRHPVRFITGHWTLSMPTSWRTTLGIHRLRPASSRRERSKRRCACCVPQCAGYYRG
jgi:hypothetical protein